MAIDTVEAVRSSDAIASSSSPAARTAPPPERRPFRDNPRLILLGIVLLFGALAAMVFFADQSTQLNPDFLSEVVLYALSAADLTMVLVLVFVLARKHAHRLRPLSLLLFAALPTLSLLLAWLVPAFRTYDSARPAA